LLSVLKNIIDNLHYAEILLKNAEHKTKK